MTEEQDPANFTVDWGCSAVKSPPESFPNFKHSWTGVPLASDSRSILHEANSD